MSTMLDQAARRVTPTALPATHRSLLDCVRVGFSRQPWGSLAALAAGWTALSIALWLALIGAIVGGLGGLYFAIQSSLQLGNFGYGVVQGVSFFGVLGGAAGGALTGFGLLYGGSILADPGQVLLAMVVGAAIGSVICVVYIIAEARILALRGYRRMSRRERERVEPLLLDVAKRMGIGAPPPVLMSDSPETNAYAYAAHVLLTRGTMKELEEDELAGILAHELHHWQSGDAVSNLFVWGCAWPVAVGVNVGAWLMRFNNILSFVGLFLFWPFMVLTRFFIIPVVAVRSRRHEYEADAAALRAGVGLGLHRALTKIADFESGHSGWEVALASTHPPTELRLEALEAPTISETDISSLASSTMTSGEEGAAAG